MKLNQTESGDQSHRARAGGLFAAATLILSSFALGAGPAMADYPEEDIEFVVPFSAGGGSDVLARTIQKTLDDMGALPVELVIENRPGGSGAVGYSYLAQQAGNPHYLGTVSVSFFTTPILGESPVNYKDFTPVAAIAMDPYIMVVRSGSEIESIDDLRGRDALVAGTPGVVSDATLIARMLDEHLDYKIDVVPYDGSGEVISALLGGHVDVQFVNPSEGLPQIEAGEMRPIAVSSSNRLESLPDVATFQELGFDIEHAQLRGVVMPADVSEEALSYWEDTLRTLANSEEWKENYLNRYNVEAHYLDSDAFGEAMVKTSNMYETMMRELDVIE